MIHNFCMQYLFILLNLASHDFFMIFQIFPNTLLLIIFSNIQIYFYCAYLLTKVKSFKFKIVLHQVHTQDSLTRFLYFHRKCIFAKRSVVCSETKIKHYVKKYLLEFSISVRSSCRFRGCRPCCSYRPI